MSRAIGILLTVFLSTGSLMAQNLMDDLYAVAAVLDTAKSVKIEVVCKVYAKKDGELLNTVQTGMSKKGKSTLSSLDDVDVFTNEKYGVFINHAEKSIKVISKAKYASRIQSVDDKSIDKFANWMKKQQKKVSFNPRLISETDGIRIYSVNDLEGIKELIVEVDVKNHVINRISYEFSESIQQKQQYIVLSYSKFLINSKEIYLDAGDFYIQQSGKFLPGKKYKNYSITTEL